ncbi:MAG: flagellar hook-length control protein FliK [Syntrophales bacterium]|nr:flagellar hook-length control protein FliK [Syntrophales bacterium]
MSTFSALALGDSTLPIDHKSTTDDRSSTDQDSTVALPRPSPAVPPTSRRVRTSHLITPTIREEYETAAMGNPGPPIGIAPDEQAAAVVTSHRPHNDKAWTQPFRIPGETDIPVHKGLKNNGDTKDIPEETELNQKITATVSPNYTDEEPLRRAGRGFITPKGTPNGTQEVSKGDKPAEENTIIASETRASLPKEGQKETVLYADPTQSGALRPSAISTASAASSMTNRDIAASVPDAFGKKEAPPSPEKSSGNKTGTGINYTPVARPPAHVGEERVYPETWATRPITVASAPEGFFATPRQEETAPFPRTTAVIRPNQGSAGEATPVPTAPEKQAKATNVKQDLPGTTAKTISVAPDPTKTSENVANLTRHATPPVSGDAHLALQGTERSTSGETVSGDPVSVKTAAFRFNTVAPGTMFRDYGNEKDQGSYSGREVEPRGGDTPTRDPGNGTIFSPIRERDPQAPPVENPIDPRPVITQVVEGVAAHGKNGGRVRITLEPASLGRLSMDILVHRDRIDLVVKVENPQVQQVINSRIEDLRAGLQGQGLQVVNIDVSLQGQTQDHHGSRMYHFTGHGGSGREDREGRLPVTNEEQTVASVNRRAFPEGLGPIMAGSRELSIFA